MNSESDLSQTQTRGPFAKGTFNQTQSQLRKGTFTDDAVRIASGLNRARIACRMEHEVIRFGEFNSRGQQKTYSIDILLCDPRYRPVAIEVEGEGSASKDNERRDAYLGSLGLSVMHVPNGTSSNDVIVQLDRYYRLKQDGYGGAL